MDRTHLIIGARARACRALRIAIGLLLAISGGVAAPSAARGEEEKAPRVPMSTARANNKGNDLVEKSKFEEAAEVYRDEALKRPENGILQRNLAGALARSQQMEEALASYSQALRFAETDQQRSLALYDLGNTMALAGQTQSALEAYAEAMLLAPEDLDIKHNFEYLLKQAQQQQQGQDQQDPNQEQQQDQEGDQGQNPQDQPQQEEEQQQQQEQQQDTQQPEPQESPEQQEQQVSQADPLDGMDPEDAKRLLDAMLEEEKELQAQLAKQQIAESKNVEKDW